jgi:phage gpG-like protein
MNIKVTGIDTTTKLLRGIGERSVRARPAMSAVMEIVTKGERSYVKRISGRWAPNDPDTLRRKKGHEVNRDSGSLLDSLLSRTGDSLRTVHWEYMQFGTTVYYGRFAQAGTKTAPARPVLKLRPTDRKLIRQTVSDFVVKGVT